jgi:hypothetical protein
MQCFISSSIVEERFSCCTFEIKQHAAVCTWVALKLQKRDKQKNNNVFCTIEFLWSLKHATDTHIYMLCCCWRENFGSDVEICLVR